MKYPVDKQLSKSRTQALKELLQKGENDNDKRDSTKREKIINFIRAISS